MINIDLVIKKLKLNGYDSEISRDRTKCYEIIIWKINDIKKTCHEISKREKKIDYDILINKLIKKHNNILNGKRRSI